MINYQLLITLNTISTTMTMTKHYQTKLSTAEQTTTLGWTDKYISCSMNVLALLCWTMTTRYRLPQYIFKHISCSMIYLVDNNNNSMVSICTAMTIDLDLSDEIDPVRFITVTHTITSLYPIIPQSVPTIGTGYWNAYITCVMTFARIHLRKISLNGHTDLWNLSVKSGFSQMYPSKCGFDYEHAAFHSNQINRIFDDERSQYKHQWNNHSL